MATRMENRPLYLVRPRVLVVVAEPAETGTGTLASPLRTSVARSCLRLREERAASSSPLCSGFHQHPEGLLRVPQEGRALQKDDDRQMTDFQRKDAFEKVFAVWTRPFKPDLMMELPDDFEAVFVKLQRRSGQTRQKTPDIASGGAVKAWWFLRRSGISKEQRQMVMTQLNLTGVERGMNFIMGQDSKPDASRVANKQMQTYDMFWYHVARALRAGHRLHWSALAGR